MKIGALGLAYGIFALIWGIRFFGPVTFLVLLTSWCTMIQIFTFSLSVFCKNSLLFQKFLIVSWSLGWSVCFLFWTFVFPLVDRNKLAPLPLSITTHGGLNLVMSVLFLKTDFQIKRPDFFWVILWPVIYCFGILLPLKLNGYTVYPLIFDDLFKTFVVVIMKGAVLGASFSVGCYLKKGKINKVN